MALAPQDGADARQQLARLEGLGQVVVGADLQADHAVHGITLGGQHQHRDLRRGAGQRADAAADFEAVDVGQHQVEDHQVGQRLRVDDLQRGQAAQAVAAVLELEAVLAQVLADHLGQAGVIFNHQQVVHAHGFGRE